MRKQNKAFLLYSNLQLFILLLTSAIAQAQYYYKDVVISEQISANYQLLKANKVTKVKIETFIANQPEQDGPIIEQNINTAKNTLTTYTKTVANGPSWLITYYNENGKLLKTVDSSKETIATTTYNYNEQNQIKRISNTSTSKDNFSLTEIHDWQYSATGQPEKMIKTKGGDTSIVNFILDENNNVAEENAIKKSSNTGPGATYYYYSNAKQLTDIARYNRRAKRILPDYMFEYSNDNQLIQMITVPEGSSDYQTWKYIYTNGLKEQEILYSKQKQLVGKVKYIYQFSSK